MLIDYAYFGEVISLDTTYCTNRDNRPLAIFSGINHYRGGVIFGAALLYDETIESFKWLFEIFLRAHKNVRPLTIFTNQDAAMTRALQEVMPEVKHALCTWHISRNAMKHLNNSTKDGSHIMSDFNHCMYHCWNETEFEEAWQELLSRHRMEENAWLISMYQIKEKWAACYIKGSMTLGMRSIQISKSINYCVKSCTHPKNDLNQFFQKFEQAIEDKRYTELEREFDTRDKLPRLILQNSCMLRQLSEVYTRPIFDLFQFQYDLRDATCIKERKQRKTNEDEENCATLFDYVITMVNKRGVYSLTFDPLTETITYSCKKFERVGILCCHALRVLYDRDVKLLPEKYITKRWTREARSGVVYDLKGKQIKANPKLETSRRYRQLCPMVVKLASDASESLEAFSLVHEGILELTKRVNELRIKQKDNDGDGDGERNHKSNYVDGGNGGDSKVIGFKKRDGRKSKKRLRSCVEKSSQKRQRIQA
ncbi:protein FAR-RED IMPAIRED RESPONSE 1-like [Prosopis cineraria]|uniref:protein FAR-RED IMPAIRED RESPONSE 1-like n=1 Tax=Prosopis cineraria TaxID=364024 RepID=UPI00241079CC|nr:protein FAR-RED IMPAIRED RESPONSE 1-like [Prosopis cineraria]